MSATEARAARLERASLFMAHRRQGLTANEIGERYGISGARVRQVIIEFFPPERVAGTCPHPRPSLDRPAWSIPDDYLIAEAQSGRSEIERAEGFKRRPL